MGTTAEYMRRWRKQNAEAAKAHRHQAELYDIIFQLEEMDNEKKAETE